MLSALFVIVPGSAVAPAEGDYTYTVDGENAIVTGYTGVGGAISIPSTLGGHPVVAIDYGAFIGNDDITAVTMPDSITTIDDYAFNRCGSLGAVTLGTGVTSIGNSAFRNCTVLIHIFFLGMAAPTSVGTDWIKDTPGTIKGHASAASNFPATGGIWHGLTMGYYVDRYAGDLYHYTLSGGKATVTDYVGSGGDITIPSSLGGYPATAIQNGAFYDNEDIISLIVPNSYTTIGNNAFQSCHVLQTVVLGTGITSIGAIAFGYCPILSTINFYGLEAPTSVGADWVVDTPSAIRGHAPYASNFPRPGEDFHGLIMGTYAPFLPGIPTGLSATPGDGQVQLSWTAASNMGEPVDYYVVYRDGADVGHPTATSFTDTGLTNGQSYDYYVRAHNPVGLGTASSTVTATPEPAATVPGAPVGLSAEPGDQQVTLIWFAPVSDGGAEIEYYLVYRDGMVVDNPNTTTYTDVGLANGHTYQYQVSAVNSIGEGPKSSEISASPISTINVPSAPRNLTATPGNAYINLTWEAPVEDGGSPITNYQVWRGTTSGSEVFLADADTDLWYNDTAVTNGIACYYEVRAQNAEKFGPYSNEAYATPSHSIMPPSAPLNLTAMASNGLVILTWEAPAEEGSAPVTNYFIYWGTAPDDLPNRITVSDVLVYSNAGLINGQTYYYQVSANNSVGEGERSDMAQATPEVELNAPSAPQNLTATPGVNIVTLAWDAPIDDGGSPITGYKIYRYVGNDTPSLLGTVAANILSYVDTTVSAGTTYTFYVIAMNANGDGESYEEVSIVPLSKEDGSSDNMQIYVAVGVAAVVIAAGAAYFLMKRKK